MRTLVRVDTAGDRWICNEPVRIEGPIERREDWRRSRTDYAAGCRPFYRRASLYVPRLERTHSAHELYLTPAMQDHPPRGSDDASVLVVEDEESLAELYRVWLETHYTVDTAYTGEEAEAKLDETVDVVILDRRLPDATGREVLELIRDRDLDCMVAIVSAVTPEFEIVDFPIDDYLTKPVEPEQLRATVDELLLRATVPITRQELLALHSRKIALEDEMDPWALQDSAEYEELTRMIEMLESKLAVSPQAISSRYRPDACPDCDLRWNLDVEGFVGFVPMAARVWKCVQCGRVVHKPDPSNRSVARSR